MYLIKKTKNIVAQKKNTHLILTLPLILIHTIYLYE